MVSSGQGAATDSSSTFNYEWDTFRIVPPSRDTGLCPPDPDAIEVVGTFVPEPGTLTLFAAGVVALMRKQRRGDEKEE